MHTLIIETQAETDYKLLLELAQRLGLRVREKTPVARTNQATIGVGTNPSGKRPLGTMKGSFQMAPDFDEPLDDLNEYM